LGLSPRRGPRGAGLALPATALLFVCFAIPLLGILWQSLSAAPAAGVTARHYAKALTDGYYLGVLWTTVRLSLWITLVSFVVGYPIAYLVTRVVRRRWLKRLMYAIVIAPLFTSAIVRAFGWMVLLGRQGIVNKLLMGLGLIEEPLPLLFSEAGVIIGSVYILTPFMVLTVASVLQNLDRTLEEAAADLGARPFVSFWTVTWPLSLPGVVAGAVIVFTLSMSAYVTPSVLGGGKVKVLAMLVFEQFMSLFQWPFGSALAVVLLVVTLAVIAVAGRWGERRLEGRAR
jgi:putative spermidine/putrescine transport system permease protein